ncbi:hypothetical protein BV22DRAFT_1186688 [Leucogyrophana mollusca]|uniref:Uncharacterized protein n=1 Tax=Leucogyrophana mollusca TaxID=85980 RepID=A0ACB8AZ73_9AGAM|nr:hypothetical protein BV22DRAFT_1186688 [Leucogyrophana mollusca]
MTVTLYSPTVLFVGGREQSASGTTLAIDGTSDDFQQALNTVFVRHERARINLRWDTARRREGLTRHKGRNNDVVLTIHHLPCPALPPSPQAQSIKPLSIITAAHTTTPSALHTEASSLFYWRPIIKLLYNLETNPTRDSLNQQCMLGIGAGGCGIRLRFIEASGTVQRIMPSTIQSVCLSRASSGGVGPAPRLRMLRQLPELPRASDAASVPHVVRLRDSGV